MSQDKVFEYFRRAAELFSACMEDYLYVYDMKEDIYYISEDATRRFLVPSSIFSNAARVFGQFVYPKDMPMLSEDLELVRSGKKLIHDLHYRWLDREGRPIWINCKGQVIHTDDENALLMIGCINEIGSKQLADNVSGLLGEVSFKERLPQIQGLPKCFFMRLGIDDFRSVNEYLGNAYGDQVLNDVAQCILSCVKPGQFAYRMPSDEFLIFDMLSETERQVKDLYRAIRRANDDLLEQQYYEALYTISCGVISHEDIDALDYEDITRLSQYSLSYAKEHGKNQIYFFRKQDYDVFLANREMTRRLRRAVSENYRGFELFFQPIVHAQTGEVFAAEALLRYRREDGTMLPPGRFVPQLEESGLIIPLGRWIIHTALHACVECQKHKADFKVSINLSYVQLLKSPIYDDLIDAIEQYQLAPDSVIVEMTESGYLEESGAISSIWHKLKEYGVMIALDDFGTGYSNLINISYLHPDFLKIDREFTLKALNHTYERKLLAHIIEMVHSLEIQEVVEGVEEHEEWEKMMALGTDFIQGYYFSKPCPIPEFMDQFLEKEPV